MIEQPTTQFGLTKELRFGSGFDDLDWMDCEHNYMHTVIQNEFSKQDGDVLVSCIEKLKSKNLFKYVMEIGVQRSGELSSTCRLMAVKPQETIYLGVDIKEASIATVEKPHLNAFGLVSDSGDHYRIIKWLDNFAATQIDLLIIDGFHSINQVYRDFRYAERLSVGGIVFMHDTNYHPGPKTLLDCVDERLFNQKKYFEGENDWGCAVLERL